MSQNDVPRTPTRPSARSVQRTPLSPSIYSGLSNVSLSSTTASKTGGHKKSKSTATGAADLSNPFLVPFSAGGVQSRSQSRGPSGSRSRNGSPMKRTLSNGTPLNEEFKKQAKAGIISKGGIELKMDVVQMDYVAPTKTADESAPKKKEIKRSRSTPSTSQRDRFITASTSNAQGALSSTAMTAYSLASAASDPQNPASSLHSDGEGKLSPGHTQRLIEATGLPIGKRILGYHEQPPTAGSGKGGVNLGMQREYAKPLFARSTSSLPGGVFQAANVKRTIPKVPERVLDAPAMVDDYYLNLLDWSVAGKLAVALEGSIFLWDSDSGSVTQLCTLANSGNGGSNYVASVKFSQDGNYLAIGTGEGTIELWDVNGLRRLRTMAGRQGQISSLSWNDFVLSAGCGDGSIWHSDVRAGRHKVQELLCHTGEVCGLTWRSDGEYLASGGNDNVVCIWDRRIPEAVVGRDAPDNAPNTNPKWTKRNHTAAVKALAWSPWSPNLLATGGGTNDATINVWNASTGARVHSVKTPSQITSLIWSPTRKEILSTHGYPTNALMLHAYPSMDRVAEIRDAHDQRVLYTALSPEGDVVVTGAGDEALKFWRLWEGITSFNKKEKRKEAMGAGENFGGHASSTRSGVLSIR